MIQPIDDIGVVLYGNEGEYKLIAKEGEYFTYEFTPFNSDNTTIEKKTLDELSELVGFKLLWVAWDN